MIHPTALIDSKAELGTNVAIGAYSIIERGCQIGDNVCLKDHVVVRKGSQISQGVFIDSFTVIGGLPQDRSFNSNTPSSVFIGGNTVIRESVTVSRAKTEGGVTHIGNDCLIMACVHVAHDCIVGNGVNMANSVLLAGHVQVGDYAFLGGNAIFHQFIRVGESAMVGGGARVSLDIPHFTLVSERNCVHGLNLVGLKRRGFTGEVITDLKHCFQCIFKSATNPIKLCAELEGTTQSQSILAKKFISFYKEPTVKGCMQGAHYGKKANNINF